MLTKTKRTQAIIMVAVMLPFSAFGVIAGQLRLDDLSQTRERPLFSETRRPPPKVDLSQAIASTRPPPPIVPPSVTLVGVVLGTDERSVIVQEKTAPKPLRVSVGDDIDGWRVDSITSRSFILKNGERAVTLTFPQK